MIVSIAGKSMRLDIAGLGIILYSPRSASHIEEGQDYLESEYTTEEDVQRHIQAGSIVGFGTGLPGTFVLQFHGGYPEKRFLQGCDFKLRLGLACVERRVCFRDLYDLVDWTSECPPEQMIEMDDGIYHVTLCSNRPRSGRIGDGQMIHVYFQKLDMFPALSKHGIPTLYDES